MCVSFSDAPQKFIQNSFHGRIASNALEGTCYTWYSHIVFTYHLVDSWCFYSASRLCSWELFESFFEFGYLWDIFVAFFLLWLVPFKARMIFLNQLLQSWMAHWTPASMLGQLDLLTGVEDECLVSHRTCPRSLYGDMECWKSTFPFPKSMAPFSSCMLSVRHQPKLP